MSRKEHILWDLVGMALALAGLWTLKEHVHPLAEVMLLASFLPLWVKKAAR